METYFNKDVPDMVNHPAHYVEQSVDGFEPIDLIEFWPTMIGNAMKYVIRAGHKGDVVEDLRKARWYLLRALESFRDEPIFRANPHDYEHREFIAPILAFAGTNAHINALFATTLVDHDKGRENVLITCDDIAKCIRTVDDRLDEILDKRIKALSKCSKA